MGPINLDSFAQAKLDLPGLSYTQHLAASSYGNILHLAAYYGNAELFNYYLKLPGSLRHINKKSTRLGYTPIQMATCISKFMLLEPQLIQFKKIIKGKLNIVRELLSEPTTEIDSPARDIISPNYNLFHIIAIHLAYLLLQKTTIPNDIRRKKAHILIPKLMEGLELYYELIRSIAQEAKARNILKQMINATEDIDNLTPLELIKQQIKNLGYSKLSDEKPIVDRFYASIRGLATESINIDRTPPRPTTPKPSLTTRKQRKPATKQAFNIGLERAFKQLDGISARPLSATYKTVIRIWFDEDSRTYRMPKWKAFQQGLYENKFDSLTKMLQDPTLKAEFNRRLNKIRRTRRRR